MQLTGAQILWVCLTSITLGTIVYLVGICVLKRDMLELVRADNGGLMLRLYALTSVVFWVAILTLANKVPESAATAIFGSILGYVFGVGTRPASPRTKPAREAEPAPEESDT